PVDFGEKWKLFKTAWSKLLKETSEHGSLMISAGPPIEAHVSYSGTFGWDDPFSLSWLLELTQAKGFDSSSPFGHTSATIGEVIATRASGRAKAMLAALPGF